MNLQPQDIPQLRRAIQLAQAAERRGNLPIGAIISLNGEIIAEGMNTIWQPHTDLTRHAEMEALRAVPVELWPRAHELTLVTTLEPCLMCLGAILLHQIGRLVFGATDAYGGAGSVASSSPPYFRNQFMHTAWVGPALAAECDPLAARVRQLEQERKQSLNGDP